MRILPLTLGLASVICYTGCGGRTSGWDTTGATGADHATGGNGATEATGGSGATTATGGKSPTKATGGSSPTKATGGRSAVTIGGSGATTATGGKSAGSMGGSGATKATGGSSTVTMGGSGATVSVGGSGATKATGGSSAGPTGGSSAASGGTAGSGGASSVLITSCNDTFPFLGTWEGNILDFYFNPTEALKLELSEDASGVITGKLTWGAGAPPPTPQGPDIPYPPGYWEQQSGLHFTGAPDPWPGFAYTIVRGAGCDTTFRFGVSTSELWQDWCALQTPIDSGSFGWGCTLLGGSGSSNGTSCTIYGQNGQTQTYPLWKCNACGSFGMNGVCACDQNGCFANTTATQTFNLTYSVSGGTEILSGPDPSCGDCTVRLARQN